VQIPQVSMGFIHDTAGDIHRCASPTRVIAGVSSGKVALHDAEEYINIFPAFF
jgi:hypothetical protein